MTIRVRGYRELVDYCSANISPRRYFLHNQIGGPGWRVIRKQGYWELEIDDLENIDAHLTWLALTVDI